METVKMRVAVRILKQYCYSWECPNCDAGLWKMWSTEMTEGIERGVKCSACKREYDLDFGTKEEQKEAVK